MCGIFGYVGEPTDVGKMVLKALKRLEYRGYDSWGVATRESGAEGRILLRQHVGDPLEVQPAIHVREGIGLLAHPRAVAVRIRQHGADRAAVRQLIIEGG